MLKKYEIKTMINLRGEHKDKKWYEDEIAICKKYDVKHYDVKFSATSLPKKERLLKLFEVFDKSANLLRGKVSTDAITFIEAIRQMSEEVLNSKDEKELSLKINPINNKQYKRIGIFKSKLTEYLRILSRHMEVYVKTKS